MGFAQAFQHGSQSFVVFFLSRLVLAKFTASWEWSTK
jgi:hypothetical protein